MAAGPIVQVSDVIVPAVFTPYVQQLTEEKSAIVQSGALARNAFVDSLLAGGGLTFQVPSFKDLDNDVERVSTDTAHDDFAGGTQTPTPNKIGTAQETAVRLSRNQSWSSADLTTALIDKDPMQVIASRVSDYWARRLQQAFVATMTGVFADNAAAPVGTEHVQNDLTVNIAGSTFTAGVTDFSAEAFIDATTTMGDSMQQLTMILVHSIVYAKMIKNNLIDFIPDSQGMATIPTFLGRRVVMDDGMPRSGSIYESWFFAPGAVQLGVGSPKVPTAIQRHEGAGNGGGQETLYNRVEWCLHPVGHRYAGSAPNGGPSNLATTNNLAAAGSWQRVYTERKQIKIARLITREA